MSNSKKNLTIPAEVAATADGDHLRRLDAVCRFCFTRLVLPKRGTVANAPTQEVCERALKFYQVDFHAEIANLRLPKVLCNACRTRLAKMKSGEINVDEWNAQKRHYYDALFVNHDPVSTRQTAVCSEADRCRVCLIATERVPNFVKKAQSNAPKPGRPSKRSPIRGLCSRCGDPLDEHDDRRCASSAKRPRRAGEKFAERVCARGHTDKLVAQRLEERFKESSASGSETPMPSGASLDSHHYLGVSSFSYEGEDDAVELSRESARDLLRLGQLGLGMRSARELCKILRRSGVYFPEGGLKRALEEKWEVFGPLFRSEVLPLQVDRRSEPTSTPFAFCTDINALLNIVTADEANRITRLKLQFDGGQQFLKLSVNIVTMKEGSLYVPCPNSVLKNFVVGMGQASETRQNLEQVFGYSSVKALFDLDIPKQVACDLKVSAMMVGIQMASCKYPCPFCLYRKGDSEGSAPARTWQQHIKDLESEAHSVVARPVVQWVNSPLEFISLSPLHLLLGIVNKLYDKARPAETSGAPHSLYPRHCRALVKYNIRRSVYFDGAFEGNGCSRFLDEVAVDHIPFEQRATPFVMALKAFKVVKDKCLGLVRKEGWREAISSFQSAWQATDMPYTLKVHVLCNHVEEYFKYFEPVPDAGLGLSSEQSGESLHARLQRVWNLRFKVNPENEAFSERLVDCMVSYNWNLQWDGATRALTEKKDSSSCHETASSSSPSRGSRSSQITVEWDSASSVEDSDDADSQESSSVSLD
ncbi:hypothetical protein Pmar_PMAR020401 [Perkinsus marinus ATCC 50983]|uniref:Uncharacterized protein n=1 Tax=Perkinsus marinus (strain ATCC 50983 / TXsc) TaxID=423536 RepID=C5L6Y0_PERM5|nr:hypothetical protein Pmar_PMAR020401 [Perkinsus marinus ATCC 50983]EER07242.1 hypothetical protein Pmar_PMAR020401 [Perkinsus marinus ATCC 50983]|eukprot:XP_002775426.1 hypothetical protein Pmar_PMAR020401 [Perkinsus marinus ATCC 50983]